MKTLKIIEAKYIKDYTLKLTFSDNKEIHLDFLNFLESSKHPDVKKYLDIKKFKSFSLDNGELMWGNFDLLFPMVDLYNGKIMKHDTEAKRK